MARLSANEIALGNHLVDKGELTLAQFEEASSLAEAWGVRFSDIIFSRKWVKPKDFAKAAAERYRLPLVNLRKTPPDLALLETDRTQDYTKHLTIPLRKDGDQVTFATANPGPDALLFAKSIWPGEMRFVVTGKFDVLWALQAAYRDELSHMAVYDLAEKDPDVSAQTVITPRQLIFLYACISLFALGLALAPVFTLIALNLVMGLVYLGNFIFKAVLAWAGAFKAEEENASLAVEARLLKAEELPVFTVLVPLFKEPEVLPIIAHALRSMDYPLAKLDIKIVLEESDHETIEAAEALGLEGVFDIIRVPPSHPQTKPKACNYALRFARGDLLVIYDAEDKPEPDQLRKVVAAFRRAPENTACVQCRLNYFNAEENWLTRMFTLDYSLWFDLMLPGLERLGIPIPLGGTSNHFKLDVLRELHAWDPFNVTEDADLGIRLTQKGYRVKVIDSTTFEEANCSSSNWVRQRSRWIKGYMQTFLVHTRRPVHLVRTVGLLGVIGFVGFIGGTFLSGLLNPIFWAIFIFWLLTASNVFDVVFPPILLWLSLFNLLAGNGLFMYLCLIAPFRRGWLSLAPFGLTVFWYWVLMSRAAYKALWQLVTKPFYWEKTQHGLSKQTAIEIEKAEQASL